MANWKGSRAALFSVKVCVPLFVCACVSVCVCVLNVSSVKVCEPLFVRACVCVFNVSAPACVVLCHISVNWSGSRAALLSVKVCEPLFVRACVC